MDPAQHGRLVRSVAQPDVTQLDAPSRRPGELPRWLLCWLGQARGGSDAGSGGYGVDRGGGGGGGSSGGGGGYGQ